ncbi:ABC transporter permease subunit [Candidatus Persebacteraceae bacterium Df01]|jgi:glycine betaine/proline transport system permease protein|uniref:ABC transporter permease subunit n=1 Tax=Candidatus Doriopsillibacter californiensis TaxID=2970740 RepID=A0ABT7QN84_9GAMM|nr:ABC transporter permease subunit [Candidatus Persebacteraceae bacterium Df01]
MNNQSPGKKSKQQQNHEERLVLMDKFTGTNNAYYRREFARLGDSTSFIWSFNFIAFLLGPIWFGMRGLWKWGLPFVIVETFAVIQIVRNVLGDFSQSYAQRIESIEGTINLRERQLQVAIEKGSEKVAAIESWITSLKNEISNIHREIQVQEDLAIWFALLGLAVLLLAKFVQGTIANRLLEKRFSQWLSDRSIKSGVKTSNIILSVLFVCFIFSIGVIHYGFGASIIDLRQFPTNPAYRLEAINFIVSFFEWLTSSSSSIFYGISQTIRIFLDYLEVLFVNTPWPIVASFIILLTGLTAGIKGAVFAALSLLFMGVFEFWEKAMTTLALLGTAACISISIGVPLGVFSARRERFYNFISPIMDFMQTMPSFVFMIPVIALFSVGKPAAIIITMIFGGTPVVRLTVLGMRGVPESIREAAIAFGANKWYLLSKVDLPLAAPSIFAGINQTVMLSLAMVVVASLIGAKGLGEDVLEALQYANVGQGILAGFAILFCAMILNRIIQGKNN